jgi:diguanylate cyclase (GGDEF)-like protein
VPLEEKDEVKYVLRLFFSVGDITSALKNISRPAILVGLLAVAANVALGVLLSRSIVGPIKVFSAAAAKIASGHLHLKVSVATGDELETMADSFNTMTAELVEMKKKAENANPLTKLPGNIVIMEKVEQRIKQGKKFTVIYSDLDNFKAFNDKYGIHKGDEAIKLAGGIFKNAIKAKGNPDDFIGHEGGDDFILLTSPQRARAVADYITGEFDRLIRYLYSKEDLQRGHIVAKARDGTVKQFPIMTISLAGVSNQERQIKGYGEVTNIAAEVKKRAKKKDGSCFEMDLRKS